jgi:5-deoxy-glucuronate isomerase
MREVFFPAGRLAAEGDLVRLTPKTAGWRYAGLRVVELTPGADRIIEAGADEYAVLPLAGSATVEADGLRFELRQREDVFRALPDVAYLPRGSAFRVSSDRGARLALPFCPARSRREPLLLPAEEARVEIRGAGACTRQVNNILDPDVGGPDRLLVVEVLTPGGNWSSYPPHKHDEARPGEAVLEEIYYFEVRSGGFGLQRLYASDGSIAVTEAVVTGDVFCIPYGYHGPSAAAPGYDLYYLNVLAGPGEVRTMAFSDDPAHHWIRSSWAGVTTDPRIPMYRPQPVLRQLYAGR